MLLNILVLLIIGAVLISTVKNLFTHRDANDNSIGFLGKDSTVALRGFAIIMIAFSHICQYEKLLKEILIGGASRTQFCSHVAQSVFRCFFCFLDMDVTYLFKKLKRLGNGSLSTSIKC